MLINLIADLLDAISLPSKPYGHSGGLSSFDFFRIVVGYFDHLFGTITCLLQAGGNVSARTYSLRCALTIAIVGYKII